ncbi:MAG: beta-ketoacyl-[acyl-carrier-protein] synthase family protein [Deltaproteobacteria bacterium]|nr:beta-ketoacyl-[acyl-carrier-protein] synthase family protein [Deltaproteobacteria bacterium]MCL5792255.1 beta-ketoacyl-[acyl-carrier-protein] synthase family protein [Deltaproteobacteria bacterium]
MMASEGIFITGSGILNPLGRGHLSTLRSLKNSVRGIRNINLFEVAADQLMPVANIDTPLKIEDGIPRTHALALAAAQDAMEGHRCTPDAIVIGVTTGGMSKSEVLLNSGVKSPKEFAYHGTGTVATYLAKHFSCHGPVFTISTACSSGTVAIKIALELIRQGKANRVLAGGVDALCWFTYFGFLSLQLLDPKGARPLDRDRAGISLGEGAAMFLIERAKNPPPGSVTQVLGGGISCDAYHPTAPHPTGDGALKAMRDAIADAGIDAADIGYVNLHGTATMDNDASEAMALKRLFGDRIPPLSSTKGMTGHSLGAAGAVEFAICSLSVSEGIIPGNIGCMNLDSSLGILPVLKPESRPVKIAMSNSFGFGGNNASVIIGSVDVRPPDRPEAHPRSLQVTGLACLTGAGDMDASFQKFSQGISIAGTLNNEEISKDLSQRYVRRLKRISRMALALATAAHKNAGGGGKPSSIYFGTGWGPLSETYDFLTKLFESDMRFASPTDFINSVHNAPAGQVAMEFKSTGANMTASGGDYSFEQALWISSLLASEKEALLLFGADEMHKELSPLFDPSVALDTTPSDGGGAIMAIATTKPSGPTVTPLVYVMALKDAGWTIMNDLNISDDINAHYGAIFYGIPLAYEEMARNQLTNFLSHSGFRGPVIDYRKYTGQYAASSAVAVVLAIKTIEKGFLSAGLTGTGEVSLGKNGILVMGFGPYCTAIGIHN